MLIVIWPQLTPTRKRLRKKQTTLWKLKETRREDHKLEKKQPTFKCANLLPPSLKLPHTFLYAHEQDAGVN